MTDPTPTEPLTRTEPVTRTGPAAQRSAARRAARRGVEGLAPGDAFGESWFPLFRDPPQAYEEIGARRLPEEPEWHWTDDTAMALGILRVLDEHGEIRSTELAQAFGLGYDADPARGYGYGMHELLPRVVVRSRAESSQPARESTTCRRSGWSAGRRFPAAPRPWRPARRLPTARRVLPDTTSAA